MTGMKGSQLKAKIARQEPVFGTFLGVTDPAMARIFAQIGFDFLLIDMEHCVFSPETLQQVLYMFEGTHTCPIVRVPWHEQVWTKWALDAGAEGILFPNVMTVDAARQAVANCKYPPEGIRGFFPRVASNFLTDLDEYMDGINDRIVIWAQVEHIDAVDRLDSILEVPGIDALYIGPADLSMSMGILNQYDNPLFLNAIQKVFTQAARVGMPVAYHLYDYSPELINKISTSVQIFSYGFDWIFARQAAAGYLKDIKRSLAKVV